MVEGALRSLQEKTEAFEKWVRHEKNEYKDIYREKNMKTVTDVTKAKN